MNKIFLILQREYISRVKKKSFLLTTFLTPLLVGGLYGLAIYLSVRETDDRKVVKVVDESGFFTGRLEDERNLMFDFVEQPLDTLRQQVSNNQFDALLYIGPFEGDEPGQVRLYAETTPGLEMLSKIERALEKVVKEEKLTRLGISQATLDSLKTDIDIETISLAGEEEKAANAGISMAVGSFSGILIYMFMLIYGSQVMRGVMQEKTSKIVEILVSSVRPFQLMMGKILGVAAVGLTQFVLWLVLSLVVMTVATGLFGADLTEAATAAQPAAATVTAEQNQVLATVNEVLANLNLPLLIGMFFFYFLTGYLFYAALFAMIGSAVDSEADTQQFMFPIMLPIIASMMFFGVVIRDPSGPIAFWLSVIPFSAPIIMMLRLPFDVPLWQLLLSMVLMVLGFIGTTWMAGRVYRIGILMHGAKVNYKVLFKWLTMKY